MFEILLDILYLYCIWTNYGGNKISFILVMVCFFFGCHCTVALSGCSLPFYSSSISSWMRFLFLWFITKCLGCIGIQDVFYLLRFLTGWIYKCRDWGRRFMRLYPRYISWDNPKDPERPLVIGYVSPDYFTHSVSYFIEAPLIYHDYENFKVVVYSAVVKV